uniref:Phage baseplate assembly protein V n=1 Tax=Candidatus Kentrum sp. LFY TaxID=2126342 RepID=A0A450WH35_9GAMM|nr:MAG: phage baseplate assembly protein V [Candidatus Kentron sp. LFY]
MTDDIGQCVLKFGIVAETRPGAARARLPDLDDLLTWWLPVSYRKTLRDKDMWTPDVGEHVACLLDGDFNEGVILGAIYSKADPPPVTGPDKWHVSFADGGLLEYDRETGAAILVTTGPVHVTAGGQVTAKAPRVVIDAGEVTCTGNLTVEGRLTYRGGMTGAGGAGATAEIDGNIHATGAILDEGGNTNHHGH